MTKEQILRKLNRRIDAYNKVGWHKGYEWLGFDEETGELYGEFTPKWPSDKPLEFTWYSIKTIFFDGWLKEDYEKICALVDAYSD